MTKQEIDKLVQKYGPAWYRGFVDYIRGVYEPPAPGGARQWYLIGKDDAAREEDKDDEEDPMGYQDTWHPGHPDHYGSK